MFNFKRRAHQQYVEDAASESNAVYEQQELEQQQQQQQLLVEESEIYKNTNNTVNVNSNVSTITRQAESSFQQEDLHQQEVNKVLESDRIGFSSQTTSNVEFNSTNMYNNNNNNNNNNNINVSLPSSLISTTLATATIAEQEQHGATNNSDPNMLPLQSDNNIHAGPLAPDADELTVLSYYRQEVQKHLLVPPRPWRQIRFDLPSTVAALQLYPPQPEEVQYTEPIIPSPCIVILLDGTKPSEMNNKQYMAQMVNYLFELLKYQTASTAMTMVRFVKRGSELSQLVITFGQDIPLATRMLVELQSAGLAAGFGQPISENPPNATFQIIDYKMTMHDGNGITAEDIEMFLQPFRQSGQGDIAVIEGYEPGVFYAPVKRPETVFNFLWNPFCSFMMQSGLFDRYGILITMAHCPHEFLTKGVPFYLQKKTTEMPQGEQMHEDVRVQAMASPVVNEPIQQQEEEEEHQQQQLPLQQESNEIHPQHSIDIVHNSNNVLEYQQYEQQKKKKEKKPLEYQQYVEEEEEEQEEEPYQEYHQTSSLQNAQNEIDIFDTQLEGMMDDRVLSTTYVNLNNKTAQVVPTRTTNAPILNDEDEDEDEDENNHKNADNEKQLQRAANTISNNINNNNDNNTASVFPSVMSLEAKSNNNNSNSGVLNYNVTIPNQNDLPSTYLNITPPEQQQSYNDYNSGTSQAYVPHNTSMSLLGNREYNVPHAPFHFQLVPPVEMNANPFHSSSFAAPTVPQQEQFSSSNVNMNSINLVAEPQKETPIAQSSILPETSSSPTNMPFNMQAPYYNYNYNINNNNNNNNNSNYAHYTKPFALSTPILQNDTLPYEQQQQQQQQLQQLQSEDNVNVGMTSTFYSNTPHYLSSMTPAFNAPQSQTWMQPSFQAPLQIPFMPSLQQTSTLYTLPTETTHSFSVMASTNMNDVNGNIPYASWPLPLPITSQETSIHNNNFNDNLNNSNQTDYSSSLQQQQEQQQEQTEQQEQNGVLDMTVEDAEALIEEIEEQIQLTFIDYKGYCENAEDNDNINNDYYNNNVNDDDDDDDEAKGNTCVVNEMTPEQVVNTNSLFLEEYERQQQQQPEQWQLSKSKDAEVLLPFTSAINVLMQLIMTSHARIQFVLQSTSIEFTKVQTKLVDLLLSTGAAIVPDQNGIISVANNTEKRQEEEEEGDEKQQEGDNNNSEELQKQEKKEKEEERHEKRVALLPYLLYAPEGVCIASTLAAYYSHKLSNIFVRYLLLFLLNKSIIQLVCIPCLVNNASTHNPLVLRLLRHWVQFAMWIKNYITLQAKRDAEKQFVQQEQQKQYKLQQRQQQQYMWNSSLMLAEQQQTSNLSSTIIQKEEKLKESLVNAATKRILSLVGNTLESIITVMSVKQRSLCKDYSEMNELILSFKSLMELALYKTKNNNISYSNNSNVIDDVPILTEEDVNDIKKMRMLWELEGAVWRTIIRLYLNADIINGETLANVLFTDVDLTQELIYFVLSTTVTSQISSTLNLETARFCGTFLKILEEKVLVAETTSSSSSAKVQGEEIKEEEQEEKKKNKESSSEQENAATLEKSRNDMLYEKEALQLVQSALRSIAFPHIYEAFQRSYQLERSHHFTSVINLLSLPPPLPTEPPPPFPVKHYTKNSNISSKNYNGSISKFNKSQYSSHVHERSKDKRSRDKHNDREDKSTSSLTATITTIEEEEENASTEVTDTSSRWSSAWSTVMSTYPERGEPFTPLPTSWRSALSRSYGHYYFIPSNSHSKATYKHPFDRKEYMATPQAFVKAFSKEITLPRILTHALAEWKRVKEENKKIESEGAPETSKATSLPSVPEELQEEEQEPTQLLVNRWWHDQRIRHFYLDTAVMDLLCITYRTGSTTRSGNTSHNADKSSNRRKVCNKDELRECLRVLDRYPISGAPFPSLSSEWVVKMDESRGMYVFESDTLPFTLLHPRTNRMYRVSPQAFASKHNLAAETIAERAECSRREVTKWLSDQTYRRSAMDWAVMELVPVTYAWYDELDRSYSQYSEQEHHRKHEHEQQHENHHHRRRRTNSNYDSDNADDSNDNDNKSNIQRYKEHSRSRGYRRYRDDHEDYYNKDDDIYNDNNYERYRSTQRYRAERVNHNQNLHH